jgi:predicted DNA-binding protein YlxM (UPF0122 family)
VDLEKVAWTNLLYDFYGQLLTGRQRDTIEFYYGQNLSLGEIAAELEVTRQAVHDALKRAELLLGRYEEKLGLAGKHLDQQDRLKEANRLLDSHRVTGESGHVLQAQRILEDLLE